MIGDGGLSLNFSGFDSLSKFPGSFVGSDPSSPVVDSVSASGIWATEMESISCASSDEEILNLAWLTRRFALSSIDDHNPNSKGWGMSRSPQSTLSRGVFGGCCDCHLIPSNCSPSSVSSAVAGKGRDETLDLLRAAAGEVAMMRSRIEQGTGFFSPRTPKSSSPFHLEKQLVNQGASWQGKADERGRSRINGVDGRKIGAGRPQPLSPSSGWTHHKAVFLGSPKSKKERAGTGVFLPKPTISPRNKTSCSAALIPAKVVQALNNLSAQSDHPSPSLDFDAVMRSGEAKDWNGTEKRSPRVLGASSLEVQLPQEWIY